MRNVLSFDRLVILGAMMSSLVNFAQPIPGQYIAVLKNDVPNAGNAARQLGNQHGLNIGHVYQHAIRGFAFSGNAQAAQALARNPSIAYVEQDQLAHTTGIPSGVRRIGIDETVLGLISPNGQDVNARIAILDTGIDAAHPDLKVDPNGKRFFWSKNKLTSNNNFADGHGHGTHVAGTAAANGTIVGVAPGALVTAIKVLEDSGSGPYSQIIAGVDWVTANAALFDAANMSLGGGFSQAMNDAVRRATEAGVVVCVSAGNAGADTANQSPASEPAVITVSAMIDFDGTPSRTSWLGELFAHFSNFGSGVDICAPGYAIQSTWPGGGYANLSGTSMASPHVAGAAALYIANNRQALSGLAGAARVAFITQALKQSGWQGCDYGYFNEGDFDGVAEPLLNAASLLGFTQRPQIDVSINLPTPNAAFALGQEVLFDAFGSSPDAIGALFWEWNSAYDGQIGTSQSFSTATLSEGPHAIVASLTEDGSWFSGTAATSITVGNAPPQRQLILTVVSTKAVYNAPGPGNWPSINYWVTDAIDGSPVSNALIDSTMRDARGGTFRVRHYTDTRGLLAVSFVIDVTANGQGTYTVTGSAQKAGYLNGQGSTSFEVRRR